MRRSLMQVELATLERLVLFNPLTQGKLAGVDIHTRIKTRRTHLKLSFEQLAARVSELEGLAKPLAWQTVQQWENGTTVPRHRRLQHVAAALEIPLEDLMGTSAPSAKESSDTYAAASWPFQMITRDQIAQLTTQQLAGLEKAMVKHLLQPTAAEFRAVALDVAARLDHTNKNDSFTRFIRAVDIKLRDISTSPQAEPAAT